MNIFDRDKINWEDLSAWLLWYNVVSHGNEYSGYDIITKYKTVPSWCKDNPEQIYQRGYKPGDIVRDIRFLSYYIGPTRQLSWKELTLALGFWKDILLPDHHDCSICERRKKCKAYFKDDPDQSKCSCWMEDHGYDGDEEEYKKFIDNLLNPTDNGELKVDLSNISKEELKTILDTLNISEEELKDFMSRWGKK